MAHPTHLKIEAQQLRKKGFSIKSIKRKLGIAQATASLWVRGVHMREKLRTKLNIARVNGSKKGLATVMMHRAAKAQAITEDANIIVRNLLKSTDADAWKLVAALLFWAEGSKNLTVVKFTNSDPRLIRTFLHAMRNGFGIKEEKLRVLMHLHEYHDEAVQKAFWSSISGIPESRFNRSYLKPHTGNRKREGYQGCIAIHYFDATLAKRLSALYYAFAQMTEGAWCNG